jgi:hypothetical protein
LSGAPIALAEGVDAKTVIDQYLQAIGGREALSNVHQMTMKSTARVDAGGRTMELTMNSWQVAPDRLCQETRMGDMLISKMVFDGKAGWMSGMSGNQDFTGKELESIKQSAVMFPELSYSEPGYKLELVGIEKLNGKDVYQLRIVNPSGASQTEYYNISTGLKVRTTSVSELMGQTMENSMEYGDYRNVDGILFPFSTKQTGNGPQLEITVNEIDIKTEVDPSHFIK